MRVRSLLRTVVVLAVLVPTALAPRRASARPASSLPGCVADDDCLNKRVCLVNDAGIGMCELPKRPTIVAMHLSAGILVLGRRIPAYAEEELSVGFRAGENMEVGFALAHLSRFDHWPEPGVRVLPLSLHVFASRPRYDVGATFRLGTGLFLAPFTAGAQLDARVWLLDNLGLFGAAELCLFSQSGTAVIAPAFRIGLAIRL